jgi:hypothetical protein
MRKRFLVYARFARRRACHLDKTECGLLWLIRHASTGVLHLEFTAHGPDYNNLAGGGVAAAGR